MIISKFTEENFDYYASKAKESWRILWRGKILTLSSGKSCWSSEGHARAAFKVHMNYGNNTYFIARDNGLNLNHGDPKLREFANEVIKFLEDSKQIEFKQI